MLFRSPELVGHLSDYFTGGIPPGTFAEGYREAYGLKRAVLILPGALAVAAVFWLVLAARMRKTLPTQKTVEPRTA